MKPMGIGADIGLVHDASAIVAVIRERDTYRVDDVLEMKPAKGAPLSLSHVIHEFMAFAMRFEQTQILVDHHVLAPAREYLRGCVQLVPVHGGQETKVETYLLAKKLFVDGKVQIPERFKRLADQLRAVVAKPTPGGGMKIDSPRRKGSHGDIASAFILALTAARATAPSGGAADYRVVSTAGRGWSGAITGTDRSGRSWR